MPATDTIRVCLDPETRDVIDRVPHSVRSRFVRACILHAMEAGRRACGLPGAPAAKVSEVTL